MRRWSHDWTRGSAYIVRRRRLVMDLDSSHHPRIKPPLNQGPRCGFLGRLGNLLEHTRSGATTATGGGRLVPLSGRSVHDGPHLGSSLTGACVVVPCPKSINSHQTEFRWGSYARFTEPRSATDIFWLWTPNMANDISVSIISTSSSQCYTLILRFEILLDCSFVGVGSEYDWDTSWSRYSAVFLFSPYKSQLHQNSWKYVSVNPNKVI
jgi:hypothetical protein